MSPTTPKSSLACWQAVLLMVAGSLGITAGWTTAQAGAQEESAGTTVQVMEVRGADGTVQKVERVVQPGQAAQPPQAGPPGDKPPGGPGRPGKPGEQPPGTKPPTGDASKPGEEGKESPQKTEPIRRPDQPSEPPDPDELKVRPNEAGMVSFQFRGQSWPDVIDWLGEISNQSVDWQELPGDYVNLATQREYSVTECRDLINRLLLARGYTLLDHDGFMMVVKCEGISAGLVPRVAREQLETRQPNDFVRVLLPLDWMLAEEVAKELEPLLSKNGKLFPLKTTNRLEAMDAVANLLQIDSLLREEQSNSQEEPRLVREFVLAHARAKDVHDQLQQFLGLSSGLPPTGAMTPQQMAQQQQRMMQMQMQMQQQQQRQPSRTPVPPTKTEAAPVRLMINTRRNSLLVQAPPDKMAVIEDAIRLIDVPSNEPQSLQGLLGRMRTYRLSQLDPKKLATTLQELGCLEPTTRLEVDEDHRAIIAYASPADHFTIQSTIEKLDGSARRVEVIPLKRMPADEVAGTIEFLMNGSQKEDSSRRSYDYYYPYSYRSRSNREETNDAFRIDADIVNNRLLVRANDVELEEVMSILAKLGEVPQAGGDGSLTRVLDITPGEQTDKFLRELKQGWKLLAPNPLVTPQATEEDAPAVDSPSGKSAPPEQEPVEADQDSDPSARRRVPQPTIFRTALYQDSARDAQLQPADADEQPPIMVTIGADGRVVLVSKDPRALDLLEELAARIAPRQKDYKVFTLEHAPAGWVVMNLEEFFEDEQSSQDRRSNRMMSFIFGIPSSGSRDEPRRLSQRRPLKFISDIDTNTILVQGADEQQLQTIADLIELYDVPEPVESQSTRVTKLFPIKYSRASVVAETVKDAYRDLLSDNDKALQQGRGGNQNQQRPYSGMTIMNMGFGDEDAQSPRTSVRFKGKLSIGVDDVTNTLLVSTEGEALMTVVEGMITALDERAKPVSDVRVLTLKPTTDGDRIEKALSRILAGQAQTDAAAAQANGPAGRRGGNVPPGGSPPGTPRTAERSD